MIGCDFMKSKIRNIFSLYLAYILSWIIFCIPGIIIICLSYHTNIPIGLGFLLLLASGPSHLLFSIIIFICFSISNKIELECKLVACTFPILSFLLLPVLPIFLIYFSI